MAEKPNPYTNDQHPMAAAMQWVHRVTTVVLEMVLPGLFGQWLDNRWGTSFLALLGFGLGLTTAITHLLQMTKHERQASTFSQGSSDQPETVKSDSSE